MFCRFRLVLFVSPSLFYGRGGLVPAMGAMRVVVAAARVAAGEVVVGALVPILVPVVGLVQVAAVLLLLLLEVGQLCCWRWGQLCCWRWGQLCCWRWGQLCCWWWGQLCWWRRGQCCSCCWQWGQRCCYCWRRTVGGQHCI